MARSCLWPYYRELCRGAHWGGSRNLLALLTRALYSVASPGSAASCEVGLSGWLLEHPWVPQRRSPSEASRVVWLFRWRSGGPLKGGHVVSFWVASPADIIMNALECGLTRGSNSELAKGSRMVLN